MPDLDPAVVATLATSGIRTALDEIAHDHMGHGEEIDDHLASGATDDPMTDLEYSRACDAIQRRIEQVRDALVPQDDDGGDLPPQLAELARITGMSAADRLSAAGALMRDAIVQLLAAPAAPDDEVLGAVSTVYLDAEQVSSTAEIVRRYHALGTQGHIGGPGWRTVEQEYQIAVNAAKAAGWWPGGTDPWAELDDAVTSALSPAGGAWPVDDTGLPEPCQPIGCDAGRHLPGCPYATTDAEGGEPR